MRTILLVLGFVLISFAGFGQTATIKDVQQNNKGDYQSYVTATGEVFNIGDTITIGKPTRGEDFTYIREFETSNCYPLTLQDIHKSLVIKRILIGRNQIQIYSGKPFRTIILNIDEALLQGEIVSKQISSEQALKLLKEEKDKLDLELISKEQYEAKKIELRKYIK